jgi:hypothetical protein
MIFRGGAVVVAAPFVAGATSSNCGAMISNFPKIRLLFVRLSISGLRIAGIDVFERIPWSIVVSLVEIILLSRWCCRVGVVALAV